MPTAPEDAPSINLDVINSTSLFVSWLHDIQPDKLNGILIGYRVRWKGLTSSQVLLGPEASSYTITGLVNDKMYNVYVAGRTNGGVGVEKRKNAKTHKNGTITQVYIFLCSFHYTVEPPVSEWSLSEEGGGGGRGS